jgi:nicotinamidase-related amidase
MSEIDSRDTGDTTWLEERGGVMCQFDRIDPQRTALVVIDMQDVFVNTQYRIASPQARVIIPRINRLAAALRTAGGRVFFTRHTISNEPPFALPPWQRTSAIIQATEEFFIPGSPGHAVHDLLDVQPSDRVLDKFRYSAFLQNSSTLDAELRIAGIDTVIVTGTVTNVCCESTARDAHMLNYRVFFPFDASAALTAEGHQAAITNLAGIFADTRGVDSLLQVIDASAR